MSAHLLVVGAGAIGSALIPQLARSPHVAKLTIVDRDRYDEGNLRGQQIDRAHVGRLKANAQAAVARRINPRLDVVPHHMAVEDLPLGALRATVILAALDSRRARMVVNQAAFRLGIPWIDAGISTHEWLARVRVHVPGSAGSCLECGWDQADYALVEQTYPCMPDAPAPATNAPAGLGALAASLQALACEALLADGTHAPLVDRELLMSARAHTHYVTTHRRNPACRMPDHQPWHIDALGGADDTTVEDVLAHGSTLRGADSFLSLGVAGQRVSTMLGCEACGTTRPTVSLERRLRASAEVCSHCNGRMGPMGFGGYDEAPIALLPNAVRQVPLAALGIATHDVLTLRTPDVVAHLEVGGAPCRTAS